MDDGWQALKGRWHGVALSLCGAAMLAACAPAPVKPEHMARGDYAYVKEYVSWLIAGEMKRHKITGLSIALVDDQRVVWAQGFGYADKQANIPAGPDSVYRLGSISKLFTATAAMQLAEQGKMDIDRPLADYLPGFSVRSRFDSRAPITPRNIMTHHSGLPGDRAKGMWSRDPVPYTGLPEAIRDDYVAFPPNYVFAYSNLGVTLLGDAVGRVAGVDFADYVAKHVFEPLGMSRSSFTAKASAPGLSKAYRDGDEAEEFGLRDVPAGGLNSSVADMSRFMAMIFADGRAGGHTILRPETLAEMLRAQNAGIPLDLNFHIGLGWMLGGLGGIDIQGGGPVAHHGGGTINFNSQIIVLPEQKLGVVVLSNSSGSIAAVNRIATEAMKAALEAKAGIRQPVSDSVIPAEAEWPAEALQTYGGTYATLFGLIEARPESGSLKASLGGATVRAVPCEDGQLRLKYRLLGLIPIDLGDIGRVGLTRRTVVGRDIIVGRTHDQEMLVGEKLPPSKVPPAMLPFLGKFAPVNVAPDEMSLFGSLRLKLENGYLIAEVVQASPLVANARFVLQPVGDDAATIAGLGPHAGETVRFATTPDGRHLYFEGLDLRMTSGRQR